MKISEVLYLVSYFGSLGLSLGILFFAWQRRWISGTSLYVWYVGGQTLYILGFIMGMLTPNLGGKIFWESFQFIFGQLIVNAFLIFAIEYTDYKVHSLKLVFRLSLIFPIIFTGLLATDPLHHLIYSNPHIQPAIIFQKLDYTNTPLVFTYAIYCYLISFLSIILLLRRLIHPYRLYRSQIAIIIIGYLIPVTGTVFVLSGSLPVTQPDPTAFTTVLGNLVIAWGLYRFHLFKIVPITRDIVFEAMMEPVVVLDNKNNIVDINASMLTLLGKTPTEVIGESAEEVFAKFPIPIKTHTHVSHGRTEAVYEHDERAIHYELTVWPLYNSRHETTGRIYILHDITTLKELEQELRELNITLEKRVRARTNELADAYDETLEGWAQALELRDKETEGHSRRVTETTLKIACAINISNEDLEDIRRGALLHDIGKMGIPDEILHKPGGLTDEEFDIIKKHPDMAYKLLSPIAFLKKSLAIPYSHHEKWDGTGYPQGLKGDDIPLSARIFAIVDIWDALSSDRPYRSAWEREKVLDYLRDESGKYFDPRIVNIFIELIDKGEI
jgi:PAS domain S-box-containing protein/putative nucleotidyltransferase with HDIG domain